MGQTKGQDINPNDKLGRKNKYKTANQNNHYNIYEKKLNTIV